MSAPLKIWAPEDVGECGPYYPSAVEAEGDYGGTAQVYHHDDVVRELIAAGTALVERWDSPAWGGSADNLRHTGEYIAELRAALAKIAQEG